jgi:hypothetical protein
MATIGLCMIVKNEAHVILRCLQKALPLLDFVLITDTGSTDGTQDVIRNFLQEKGLAGEVIDEPWQDFAYNRSFAMRKLREHPEIDYALMLDADNCLVFQPSFDVQRFKRGLKTDLCDIEVRTGSSIHYSPLLFSNRLPFYYRGVLHEFLKSEAEHSREIVKGLFSDQLQDSARNRDPDKYLKDANVLEEQLKIESDPFLIARYTFYLAQSYRDAKQYEPARDAYLRRTTLGGWAEEVFVSHRWAGLLGERIGLPDSEVMQSYLDAYEARPTRAETLHAAARLCRVRQKYHQAYLFAKAGLAILMPAGALFAEPWIYHFGLIDEFSIAAFWTGHYRECFDSCVKLLEIRSLPQPERERIRVNARHAIQALGQPKLENLLPKD